MSEPGELDAEVHRDALIALGRRIAEAREEAGLTQPQLGELAGIHYVTISRIETAKQALSVASLMSIASALNTTPASLLTD